MVTPAALETFRHAIDQWHDFYLLAGTAAATLMGLLFVSLSIHLEKVVGEGGSHLEAISREAFASFLIVLALALVILSPVRNPRPLGVSLMLLGGVRGVLTATRMRQFLGGRISADERRTVLLRFAFPLAAAMALAGGGALLWRDDADDGLSLIMLATMLLIADATRTAYMLLIRTARAK